MFLAQLLITFGAVLGTGSLGAADGASQREESRESRRPSGEQQDHLPARSKPVPSKPWRGG
jgi:hypothetical protein